MALDTSKIHIATIGHIYLAPLATVAPTDLTTAWSASWLEAGYTDDTGLNLKSDKKVEERRAWQSVYPVKRWVTERDVNVSWNSWEMKGSTLSAMFGGGTFTTTGTGATLVNTFTVPADTTLNEQSFGAEWTSEDGKIWRMVIPKGMVTSNADVKFHKDITGLPLTFSSTATGVGPTAYIMTQDANILATV